MIDDDVVDRSYGANIDHLIAAQQGNELAFEALTQPHQRELHVHCYRMLGTLDDADDALQETLLRAWRRIDQFEPRAPYRAWLYRIATNVCLTMLTQRARQIDRTATVPGHARDSTWRTEEVPVNLDPYPNRLLDDLAPAIPGPEATVELHESVEIAFVAAVQLLPARQRAILLLRDVIGYTAAEVAAMLATSVASINSALQRARATLEQERDASRIARKHSRTSAENEQALVRRLVDAWHASDVQAIVAVLTDDAVFTMPPQPERFVGGDEIAAFLSTVPAGGRLDRFRVVPTQANHQPAVAVYFCDDSSRSCHAHAVIVLAIDGNAIASLARFANPSLFARFGLPETLER